LLLRLRPDLVQINIPWSEWSLGSMLACAIVGVPTAVVFQLVPFHMNIDGKRSALYRWALSRNQKWITVSENNRNLLSSSVVIPKEKLLRIYNGTKPALEPTVSRLEETIAERKRVRDELGLGSAARILLTVGRLTHQKGYDILASAIKGITEKFHEARLVWVGTGDEETDLRTILDKYHVRDKVLFLGYRTDVPRLMKVSDLFIFPTRFEGHPFSLLEAMAHGLPVITSDASGITEIVDHQTHGLVFRSGDRRLKTSMSCKGWQKTQRRGQMISRKSAW
jgi:glycosyltransferase involved in cell wall biosynthesis